MCPDQEFLHSGGVTAPIGDSPSTIIGQINTMLAETEETEIQVYQRVNCLVECVVSRFAEDDESDRFDEALLCAPWLASRAQLLQQQRQELIETLEALQRHCAVLEGSRAWWHELRRYFRLFTERFRAHRIAQRDFLQDAFPGPAWTKD